MFYNFFYFLKPMFLKQKVYFLFAQFFSLCYALDQTVFPILFGKIIDAFSGVQGNRMNAWHTLAPVLLTTLGFAFIMEIFYRLSGLLYAKTLPKFQENIRMHAFSFLYKKSYNYFTKELPGDIVQKINTMSIESSRALHTIMTVIIPGMISVFLCGIFMYRVHPILSFVVEFWIISHIFITLKMGENTLPLSKKLGQKRNTLTGVMIDSISNYILVKSSGKENFETNYIQNFQTTEKTTQKKLLFQIEKYRFILSIFTLLGPCCLIGTLAFQFWKRDLISIGDVIVIFNTTWNITGILWMIGNDLPDFFTQIGTINEALSILENISPKLLKSSSGYIEKGEIIFDSVYFSHERSKTLFHNLSLTIHAGQKIGLVGHSGSGKSTFVNLIMRFFTPQKGSILIDGKNILEIDSQNFHESIGYLPQNFQMFKRSIYENIIYNHQDATLEDVVEASKKTNSYDFIQNHAEKYNTLFDQLSGGERQRINLSRIFLQYQEMKILIIDEGTSALDHKNEHDIQQNLDFLMKGKTTFVIAHRIHTLKNMDRILVFDNGKIVDDTTYRKISKDFLNHNLEH